MRTVDTADLFDRCQASMVAARRSCERATVLVQNATIVRTHARQTRASGARRRGLELRPVRPQASVGCVLFTVVGQVDDVPVRARWIEGEGLDCPDLLRARAEVVVALGETFSDGSGPPVVASLDEPTPAMLTVLRAASRVTSVELNGARLAEAVEDG